MTITLHQSGTSSSSGEAPDAAVPTGTGAMDKTEESL